jgi:outer membrane protein TolC
MLALLLALQALPAQTDSLPRVTLAEALQRSAGLDPNYVQALGQVHNAQWARRNAFAVFILPSISIGATAQQSNPPGFIFTNTLVRVKTRWTAQLVAQYDLFTGGQKFAELSRSAAELEGSHAAELGQRFLTAQFTESDFYTVVANTELDRVSRERLQRARQQLAVARARVLSGAAVSTDSLNLRLELVRSQVQVLEQASALNTSRLELGRRIGVVGPVDAIPPDTGPAPELPVSLADAVAEAARQGPEYRFAAANERAANAVYRSELGNYLPRASLLFNAASTDTAFYPKLFKQTNLSLLVTLPIWNNGQRELALSRAKVNKDVARVARQDLDRAVLVDVSAAYGTYETARESADLARDAVFTAREGFRVQQTRYSSGATTILDLLTAQVALANTEETLARAEFSTRLALAGFETILGRRLFTDKGTP